MTSHVLFIVGEALTSLSRR